MISTPRIMRYTFTAAAAVGCLALLATPARAQLTDKTMAPNTAGAGIAKSMSQEIGAGHGDLVTPDSSVFIINRDPFRAVRRGRQLFQRKFTSAQGQGPLFGDGSGNINVDLAIGAGLSDSCASCHGRPRGSAGAGGDVATRPDSRDAMHLFGLGLKEMLADEITTDLRAIRAQAILQAQMSGIPITKALDSKGVNYGQIIGLPTGTADTSLVAGVDTDLRVRPFFAHGGTISIREFAVGAFKAEMGLEAVDPDLFSASHGGRIVTPAGMVLDGALDTIESPVTNDPAVDPDNDGVTDEVPQALVDYMEFYLLNYFKPGNYEQGNTTKQGLKNFNQFGCQTCHKADFTINHDRRVADVQTNYDPARGIFNTMFSTATASVTPVDDGLGLPPLQVPKGLPFIVKNIFTDFKRHDLGPNFNERNYDGSVRTMFLTTPLWGVGTTAPYGHDGRSANLREVILRHGGEALTSRNLFAAAPANTQKALIEFLNSLVLFPPDDTASNLDPGNPSTPGFPQFGHGSIKLTVLFNDPTDPE